MSEFETFREGLKSCEAAAIEKFLSRYSPLIAVVIQTKYPKAGDDAKDIAQNVILHVLQSARKGSFDYCKSYADFSTAIRKQAIWKATDHYRSNRRHRHEVLPDDSKADRNPLPDSVAIRNERVQELSVALSELPDQLRTIIELVDLKGMRLEDVGELLGVDKGTVSRRRQAALGAIAAVMARNRSLRMKPSEHESHPKQGAIHG